METNTCNVNHLNVDAHLPPRKRLLAGLKRQNSDVTSSVPSTPSIVASEIDDLLNSSFMSQLSNHSLPNEEIVEASRIAAIKAMKVAEAARANAEEKAAKAAKAVTAAKSALDLVSILSDEAASKDRFLKKNRMKKHVTVEALYNKNRGKTNCRADEELARKLHQAINSSPRITKKSSSSDTKSHKHRRLKSSGLSARSSVYSGVPVGEGNQPSKATSIGGGVVREGDSESQGPVKKMDTIMVDLNTSKPDSGDQLKLDNGEGFQSSKTKWLRFDKNEVLDSFGRKRGRIKQKKLPLSICSFRDQSSSIEEMKSQGMQLLEENGVENEPLFSMGPSGNSLMPERTSMWKCQSFKPPACVKQNKVMQS